MKVRNGFISNSSSCSFVIDFGKKVESSKDVEEILNKDFWKNNRRRGNWTDEDEGRYHLEEKMPYEKACELIFRLIQEENPYMNGRYYLENHFKNVPDELPTYPQFRVNFLRRKYNSYYREAIKSDDLDLYMDAEEEMWKRYKRIYESICKKDRFNDFKKTPENLGFVSFGNESDHFSLKDEEWEEGKNWREALLKKFTLEEQLLIEFLRNFSLAEGLFLGVRHLEEDFS